MNNHQLFLSSLANQQSINAQFGLSDDVSMNKKQFGVSDKIQEALKLVVRKGNKVVESMDIKKSEVEDAIAFAKAQHKGAKVTVEQNGKVVREEWEEFFVENQKVIPTSKSHLKALVKKGREEAKKKKEENSEKEESEQTEAIKYDAGGATGTVTGKGKRDRGPGGQVMIKYDEKDKPRYRAVIPARQMGRLIKTARKPGTTPYDARNLSNPRLTRDHVEHENVGEAIKYDVSGNKLTGKVTGKGKRNRGSNAEVDVQYKGETNGKLPIKAKDIAAHLKAARKGKDDETLVRNVRLRKDHVELEGDDLSEMNYLGKDKKFGREFYEKDGQLHVKRPGGKFVQNLGSVSVPSNKRMMKGLVKDSNESVVDPFTKKRVKTKPAKQKMGGPVTKGGKPFSPGKSKHRQKLGLESVELDEMRPWSNLGTGSIRDTPSMKKYHAELQAAHDKKMKAYWAAEKAKEEKAKKAKKTKKESVEHLDEVSPPGFEGTVKAMKKRHSKEIDNPWALAWYMKNKGYKSHKNKDGSNKKGN